MSSMKLSLVLTLLWCGLSGHDALAEQDVVLDREPSFDGGKDSSIFSPRIINGATAPQQRFPYSVSLQHRFNLQHFCGGSLIAPDLVVTAAHCLDGKSTSSILVSVNPYNVYNPGTRSESFTIQEARRHWQNIQGRTRYDIAILKISDTSQNQPVLLNFDDNIPEADAPLLVMGWGTTRAHYNLPPNYLQEAGVNYIDDCNGITEDMMCCLEDRRGSCNGDSGGPLIVRGLGATQDLQVGLVSFGSPDCGDPQFPGIFARFSHFESWFKELGCELSASPPAYFECGGNPVPVPSPVALTPRPTSTGELALFTIVTTTDFYPSETSWEIMDSNNNRVWYTLFGYFPWSSTRYTDTVELNLGEKYKLVVADRAYDGMCCNLGSGNVVIVYGISINYDRTVALSDGRFLGSDTVDFIAEDPLTPSPTKSPAATSAPSPAPSAELSLMISPEPTFFPSVVPSTDSPSGPASVAPSAIPVQDPSRAPSLSPSVAPTALPSSVPSPTPSLNPSSSPTASPSIDPSPSPSTRPSVLRVASPAPTREPFAICFPGDATVLVQNRGVVMMKDLELGDKVMTMTGAYESVYSFGHRNEKGVFEYVKISTSRETSLELSFMHMVFVQGGRAIPVGTVKVGDLLPTTTGDELSRVLRTDRVKKKGAYAPFTSSGTIVVNDIRASTYVAIQESETFTFAGFDTGFTQQFLANAWEMPQRFFGQTNREVYCVDGLNERLVIPHRLAMRLQDERQPILDTLVAVALLIVMAIPSTLWLTLGVITMVVFQLARGHPKRHKSSH